MSGRRGPGSQTVPLHMGHRGRRLCTTTPYPQALQWYSPVPACPAVANSTKSPDLASTF